MRPFLSSLMVVLLFCTTCVHAQVQMQKPKAKASMGYILFDVGKSNLTASATRQLDSIYRVWKDSFEFRIYLYGNTDSIGKKEFNEALSHKRVLAVHDYFSKKGIDTNWIKRNAFGEEKPKFDNDSLHQHLNRRVDVIILYGLAKRPEKKVEAPKPEKKPIPKPIAAAQPAPALQQPQQPQAEADTVITCGTDFEMRIQPSILREILNMGCTVGCCESAPGYMGVKILYKGTDYECIPKQAKIRMKVDRELAKEELDTLAIYDLDKNGNRRKMIGKVKQEKRKDAIWITFRSKCIGTDSTCDWWGYAVKRSCMYEKESFAASSSSTRAPGNYFRIIAPHGYRFSEIEIRKYRKGPVLFSCASSQMECMVNLMSWKDYENALISITATDPNGKIHHIKNLEMELLSHTNFFHKNIRRENYIYWRPYPLTKDKQRRGLKVYGLRVNSKGVKWDPVKNDIPRKYKIKADDFED